MLKNIESHKIIYMFTFRGGERYLFCSTIIRVMVYVINSLQLDFGDKIGWKKMTIELNFVKGNINRPRREESWPVHL